LRIGEGILSVDIDLQVDHQAVAPPRDVSARHRDVHAALLTAPVQHLEAECVFTKVEERLDLDAKSNSHVSFSSRCHLRTPSCP
jgi:hypothetical protein